MKPIYLTALLGLLVACGPNSGENHAKADITPEPLASVQPTELIAVTRAGSPDGPDVVLVPGLASGPEVWAGTVAALPEYDYHIVHVAGFAGRAAPDDLGALSDRLAAELAALADSLDAPVLVGHSMGGFLSLSAGLIAPDAASKIVVVDSLPFLSAMMLPGQTPEQAAATAGAMRAQMQAMPKAAFDAQQLAGLPRLAKSTDAHPRIRSAMAGSDQATVAVAMSELLATDLRPALAELSVPTTVLMPWDAAMGVPQDRLRALYTAQYARAPDVDIVTIEDSFHFVMDDQPDAFHDTLAGLLND